MTRPRRSPPPRRSSSGKRAAAVVAVLMPVAAVAVLLLARGGDDGAAQARAAAQAFAAAWSRGDDARAGALTGNPAAAKALKANRAGLDGAKVRVEPGPLTLKDGRAAGRLRIAWQVPAIGAFAYSSPVMVVKGKDGWLVRYTPRTIHPRLTAGTRLGTGTSGGGRADILDRDGKPLVRERAVVRVGLQRDKVSDVVASADALAKVLHVDGAALAKAVRGAGPKQFVEAQTLRKADYERSKAALDGIPGLLTVDGKAPLAPSRSFGRALLGGVGPATAEQVAASKGKIAPGEQVGQWGLQKAFDDRLAGAPARRILVRDVESGAPVRTLQKLPGRAPRTLRTTLSLQAQTAAEQALAEEKAAAAMVVDGKTFKNFEGEESGAATFSDDFAISCNTAFVSLAPRLPAAALGTVAQDYGLGRTYDLPLGTARSHVPPGTDKVSRAAATIGQDRITATPLAMAGVAAAVQDGRWRQPRLVSSDPAKAGPAIPAGELATLRTLMREVVTRGTGTALASVPGEVAGKTGTAEFGGKSPPETHAWFVAFRGDLALSVLVEKGRSGGSVAAPLAARFFAAYGS